jgi:hypothetical protein
MNDKPIFESRDLLKPLFKAKFPTWFWGKLPYNFKWEFLCFYKLREWKDGISFVEFQINLDKYDSLEYKKFSYKPRFSILLVILNHTVFEVSIYKDNSALYTEGDTVVGNVSSP